jgi:ribosomal protein S12 methylthiotransferase
MRQIEKLRTAMPNMALRSTFIVGYPGETEAEFQGLMDFLEAVRLDKVGVFAFSPEPGTPAARLPDHVPPALQQGRREAVMSLQQQISFERNEEQVGRCLDVLVEGVAEGLSVGRSYRDAPEIDGLVLVAGELPVARMTPVEITGAMEYDLVGKAI